MPEYPGQARIHQHNKTIEKAEGEFEKLEAIAARSYINCHVKGVDSIGLDPKRRRIFIAHPGHELWKNNLTFEHPLSVGFHAHHCEIELVPVVGRVWNVIAQRGRPTGRWMSAFRYSSQIRNGKGGFTAEPELDANFDFAMKQIDLSWPMAAYELHTVYVPKDEPAAWFVFEGAEDPSYDPITYSNTDLEQCDFSELYKPMSVPHLKKLFNIIGWKV